MARDLIRREPSDELKVGSGPYQCAWRGPRSYVDGGFLMSVITISRGSFSGGKALAECLARRLGYRCIDRDVIVERAAAYGVSQEALRGALEKPPSFLDRFQHKKYLYLALFQAALTEEVRTGKAIYHGLAGHLLLKGGHPILRTRIIAPMESRILTAEVQPPRRDCLHRKGRRGPAQVDRVSLWRGLGRPYALRHRTQS